MTDLPPIPACPWCRSAKRVYVEGHRNFHCTNCHRSFDGIDDGEIGRGSPEANAQRREEYQQRRAARKGTGR
jgi:transposase-like protein